MKFIIYWLINEHYNKTYVGYSNNIIKRIKEHKTGKVKTTRDFGKFRCFILEYTNSTEGARKKEKYWKSHTGRKKLQILFKKL